MPEKDIKIIESLPRASELLKTEEDHRLFYLSAPLIFLAYLFLLGIISYLPINFSLQITGLLVGSFLLFDIFRSIKARSRE